MGPTRVSGNCLSKLQQQIGQVIEQYGCRERRRLRLPWETWIERTSNVFKPKTPKVSLPDNWNGTNCVVGVEVREVCYKTSYLTFSEIFLRDKLHGASNLLVPLFWELTRRNETFFASQPARCPCWLLPPSCLALWKCFDNITISTKLWSGESQHLLIDHHWFNIAIGMNVERIPWS